MTREEVEEVMRPSEPIQVSFEVIGDYVKFNISGEEKVVSIGELENIFSEPCEDCISRKAVLDLVEDMTDQFGVEHRVITEGVISMLPPVTPQPKTDVLDKIRAEIEQKIEQERFARSVFRGEEKDAVKAEQCTGSIFAYNNVIRLIDKYKAESEDKE